MPSRRPDRVVTHRIELGRYERERLDNMMMAYSFNKVSTPMVAGMSDLQFMLTLGALLTVMFPSIVIPWGAKTTAEVVEAIEKGIKEHVPPVGAAIDAAQVVYEEAQTAGEDSVWYNPASWRIFDFIGDIQARSFGIDRDDPDSGPISDLEKELGVDAAIDAARPFFWNRKVI